MNPCPPELLADVRLSMVKDIGPRLTRNLLAALGSSGARVRSLAERTRAR
ncbi:hypothetical protein [Aeoliella sp. SH292]